MKLKPIETKYKGYRFRSRLEARWAVFLDHLGIDWEYEHQGYELPSGYYLPDFWLPTFDYSGMFLEVKPCSFSDEEKKKCYELHEASGKSVWLGEGVPEGKLYYMTDYWDDEFRLIDCVPNYADAEQDNRMFTMPSEYRHWPFVESAATAAKSARFEHGEEG